MFPYLILGVALLVAVILLLRWFSTADPKSLATGARMLVGALAATLALLLVVTGRWHLAIAIVAFFLPFLVRWRALANRLKAARGPTPGRASTVETAYLRMSLDHDTGAIDGEVLRGEAAGRLLSQMGVEDLLALLRTCFAEDAQSAAVLESYLDRAHPNWREVGDGASAGGEAGAGGRGRGRGAMTRDEAYAILGLQKGAGEKAIKAAHRRLLSKIHPDHGGSDYLAAKINQAKDMLLGQ